MAKKSVNKKELAKIAARIKSLRNEKNISQYQLSLDAGVSINYAGMVERGRNAPSLDLLISFCKALGVTLEEFFKGIK